MAKIKERLTKPHAWYKNNFDSLLLKQSDVINTDYYIYLFFNERIQTNTGRVADSPYEATKTDYKTVFIEDIDLSIEKVSSSHFLLVPKAESKEEMDSIMKSTTFMDKEFNCHTKQDDHMKYIIDEPNDGNAEGDHEEVT